MGKLEACDQLETQTDYPLKRDTNATQQASNPKTYVQSKNSYLKLALNIWRGIPLAATHWYDFVPKYLQMQS